MAYEGNATFVTIISKVEDAKNIPNFKLISVVGNIYKITSKILVHGLKAVLNLVISPNQ